MLKNNKGALMAVVIGIAIIAAGAIGYITTHAVLYGPDGDGGIFEIANSSLNVTSNSPGWTTVQNLWFMVPVAIMIAGLLYVILSTQRLEPDRYYYGGG